MLELPSMQEESSSNYTAKVFTPEVVLVPKMILIMVFWLLVMLQITIMLRIHGEQVGEKLVTLD
jgi:hypothetical protein